MPLPVLDDASAHGNFAGQRQKTGPLALTILLHIIVLAVLFLYKGAPIPRKFQDSLTTVFLPAADKSSEDQAKAKTQDKKKAEDSARAETQPTQKPPIEPPKTVEPPPEVPMPSWMTMTRAEYAASDISKMARAQKSSGASNSGDTALADGGGDGPNGVRLYNADWYRKPTDAEINGYMPANAPRKGWGLIACRTVERFHVEDCQTLGESPLGSGFGRAVREAAWQFLVIPPRVNGKPQVGAWVRIRISYGETDPAS